MVFRFYKLYIYIRTALTEVVLSSSTVLEQLQTLPASDTLLQQFLH